VDEKIKLARARELAPETGNVALPVPADVPATPAKPDPQPAVAAAAPLKTPASAPAPAPAAAAPKVVKAAAPQPAAALPLLPPSAKLVTTAAEYQQQGRKQIQEEHFAEAIGPLTQAVKLDPYLATTFNARGYAYYRIKKYAEAIADFDEAIKLNPVYGNAYTNRGVAKRAAGDKPGADADQAKARDLLKAAAK
jgi:tetratricopeptide (TPR) repeat protein